MAFDDTSSTANAVPLPPLGKAFLYTLKVHLFFLTSADLIKDNKREADSLPCKRYIVIQRRGGYYPPAFYYSLASIANVAAHGLIFVKTNRQQKAFSCGRRWQPKADG